jgi:hypothetical protein
MKCYFHWMFCFSKRNFKEMINYIHSPKRRIIFEVFSEDMNIEFNVFLFKCCFENDMNKLYFCIDFENKWAYWRENI